MYGLGQGSLVALRLFGVGVGAFVIILLYLCVELVFANKPLLTVGAAAFAAFLPMQMAMSAAVNNDSLAQLLLLGAMLLLLRWMRARFYARPGTVAGSSVQGDGTRSYSAQPAYAAPPALDGGERVMLLALGILLGLGMATKIYAYMALILGAGMIGLTVWLRPHVRSTHGLRPSRRSLLHAIEAPL